MKITITTVYDDYECRDVEEHMLIEYADGSTQERSACDLTECPEDAKLGRSLLTPSDCLSIIEKTCEAGKNGEVLEEVVYKTEGRSDGED